MRAEKSLRPRIRGPSPEKTERTRAAIIKAAMQEFIDRGFANATMASIAQRAGLAKGTTYRYFEAKEALFSGIVRDIVTNPLTRAEQQEIDSGESVFDYCLRTLLPTMQIIEDGGRASVARLVLVEGRTFPYLAEVYRDEVHLPFLRYIRRLAEIAQARGELRETALLQYPQLLTAPLWVGMVQNGIIDPQHPVDIGAMFEVQLRLFFGHPQMR